MTRKEFNEWVNTCPTRAFRLVHEDWGKVHVEFSVSETYPYIKKTSVWSKSIWQSVWIIVGYSLAVVVGMGVLHGASLYFGGNL